MKKILILAILFLTIACGGGSTGGGGGSAGSGDVPDVVRRVWNSDASVNHIARERRDFTPKGVAVWSRKGLSQEHLTQADEALTELFEDVKSLFPGQFDPYSLDFKHYEIYEPDHDCTRTPEQGVMAFWVKDGGLNYDGSQWDFYNSKGPGVKDGASVVMAPERVFSMTTMGSTPRQCMMMVCPDLAHWKNAIRYGAEHNVGESALEVNELFNLALANRTHLAGGHPFIPSRSKGLVAPARPNWSEFAPMSATGK